MQVKAKNIPKFNHSKFLSKIIIIKECWEWSGYKDKDGYGKFSLNRTPFMAHRISFNIFKGIIKDNLVIDHICHNRSCINPEHLRQVTIKTNTLENSVGNAYFNSIKTHCNKGHEFIGANIGKDSSGDRYCKKCHCIRQKEYLARKKCRSL